MLKLVEKKFGPDKKNLVKLIGPRRVKSLEKWMYCTLIARLKFVFCHYFAVDTFSVCFRLYLALPVIEFFAFLNEF